MKKAKTMLAVLIVVGLAGGAFAFKARNHEALYITSQAHPSDCNVLTSIYTRTVLSPSISLKASTTNGGVCTTLHVTTDEN